MKRLLALAPLMLVLAGCSAAEPVDPFVTCIDVSVEYGIAEDRTEGSDLCKFVQEHEGILGGATFEETFSDLDLAREWAKAEVAKEG